MFVLQSGRQKEVIGIMPLLSFQVCPHVLNKGESLKSMQDGFFDIYVLMPLARCTLASFCAANRDALRYQEASFVDLVSSMLLGLQSMHRLKFAHRDLSISNVVVHSLPAPRPRTHVRHNLWITDLGCCRRLCGTQEIPQTTSIVCCVTTRAPEFVLRDVLEDHRCTRLSDNDILAADVWAMGMLLLYIFTIRDPSMLANKNLRQNRQNNTSDEWDQLFVYASLFGVPNEREAPSISPLIKRAFGRSFCQRVSHARPRENLFSWLEAKSPRVADLLDRMLQYEPQQRLTMDQVLDHELFRGLDYK